MPRWWPSNAPAVPSLRAENSLPVCPMRSSAILTATKSKSGSNDVRALPLRFRKENRVLRQTA